jgi:hypothetical protein
MFTTLINKDYPKAIENYKKSIAISILLGEILSLLP